MKNNSKVKFYLDKTGFFAECAVIFLGLAIAFRFFGCWGMWSDWANYVMLTLLPIFSCLLLILCILLFGKKGFFLSCIPVLLGIVFFVYWSLSFTSWVETVLCILYFFVVMLVYMGTVFGWIPTKWLLPPLFALPFLYRLIIRDIPALSNTANPVTFAAGMQEMSILGILAAMFCIGMGLRKRRAPEFASKPAPAAAEPAAQPQPAAVQQPAAAPQPAPAPAPAVKEPEAQPTVIESTPEMNAFLSDEPYTPVLTLNPEPWEPERAKEENADGNKDE